MPSYACVRACFYDASVRVSAFEWKTETFYFDCLQCVESITIPSIYSGGSSGDVIYMVMRPPRLPQVTQWTSRQRTAKMCCSILMQCIDTHTHTHTSTHTHTCSPPQQDVMFQLADADKCGAAEVEWTLRVSCCLSTSVRKIKHSREEG